MTSRVARCLFAVAAMLAMTVSPAHAQQEPEQLPEDRRQCLPPPSATSVQTPWPQRLLRMRQVWPLTAGAGVTVAVVDTGVDAAIPQLRGRVAPGHDVTGSGSADTDCLGHGTFVAGIIGAAEVRGSGFVGVAPAVTLLPIRVATSLEPDQPGSLTPERLAEGIRQAVDAGADVINVSASTTSRNRALEDAVAYAERRDVVVVASVANNPEEGTAGVTYPAAYPSVLAVGAIEESGAHASFSAVGTFVDLVAPGADVISTGPGGGGHWQGSGTSYAAPFVSGAAALVRAYHPHLTAAQVRHRLQVTGNQPAAELPDPALGWGTVDPVAAVTDWLPEEAGGAGAVIKPPSAQPPPDTAADELGAVLVTVGVAGTVVGTFAMLWLLRLSGSAQRRRWRRARTLRVEEAVSAEPPVA